MMAGINEYPLEYRRMIYKRIEAATGESAEKIEKAYFKKLEKILKRGVIKDREEYTVGVFGNYGDLIPLATYGKVSG